METQTDFTIADVAKQKISYMGIPGFKSLSLKNEVCREFGIPPEVLFKKTRKREIVNARKAYIYCVNKTILFDIKMIEGVPVKIPLQRGLRKSPSAIGRHTGFDHATMLHALKTAQNYIDTEKDYRNKIEKLTENLQTGIIKMPDITQIADSVNETN